MMHESRRRRGFYVGDDGVGRYLASSLTQGLGFAAAGRDRKSSFPELSKDASSSPPSKSPLILRLSANL